MILNILSIIVVIFCIIAISYLIGRRLRIVASINVDSLPQEREASVRKRMLQERLSRTVHEWNVRLSELIGPLFAKVYQYLLHSYEKLRAIKESYPRTVEHVDTATQKAITIDDCVARGFEAVEKEQYYDAEQDFIEAIKIDPHRIEPYQGLARVYLEQKEYNEAQATLKHLLRLVRRSGSAGTLPSASENLQTGVLYDLWKVCILQERVEEALSWILMAVEMESSNPRFLDSLTTTYIALGQRLYAERALDTLRNVNPENKKIEEFDAHINAMSY